MIVKTFVEIIQVLFDKIKREVLFLVVLIIIVVVPIKGKVYHPSQVNEQLDYQLVVRDSIQIHFMHKL